MNQMKKLMIMNK